MKRRATRASSHWHIRSPWRYLRLLSVIEVEAEGSRLWKMWEPGFKVKSKQTDYTHVRVWRTWISAIRLVPARPTSCSQRSLGKANMHCIHGENRTLRNRHSSGVRELTENCASLKTARVSYQCRAIHHMECHTNTRLFWFSRCHYAPATFYADTCKFW